MKSRLWLLSVIVALGLINPASAGLGIFSRKPKVNPAEHVPTLIMQLKTDKDDHKRANAAADLRGYDPRTHPEIMTVLIDALTKDTSAAVRSEAASTIAKLRPINQQAGFALDQAAANDPALRVRMAARQALWQYNLVGYRSGKPDQASDDSKTVKGPTLTPPTTTPTQPQRVVKRNSRTGQYETAEPPLADAVESNVTTLKPMTPTQPVQPPKLLTPPTTSTQKNKGKKSAEPEGPALAPPTD